MPSRSKVDLLPPELREELERRLVRNGFSGYRDLAAWLQDNGFAIAKSSLHEWGQKFEDRLGALKKVTEQARIIVAENPDKDNAVNDALIRLAQEKAFDVLMEMQIDPEDISLPKLMRVIADIGRASIGQKRLAAEMRAEIAKEERDRAAAAVGEAERKGLISKETLATIRQQIYGMHE